MRKFLQTRFESPRPGRSWLWLMAALALFSGAWSAAAAAFTAQLDRDSVVVGEEVTLTLNFEGGSPQNISPMQPIDGIQIHPGVMNSFQSQTGPDGKTVAVHSYHVKMTPTRAGEFVIPEFQATVNGESLSSKALTLKVKSSDPAAPPPEYASRPAFLWFSLPKNELFLGETVVAELRIYIRGDIRRYGDVRLPPPSAEGFSVGKFVEGQQYQRRVGNTPYTVIPLLAVLRPVKTGALTVGPFRGSMVLNPRDGFDPFGFFGRQAPPQQIELSLEAQACQAVPLPADNVPPDFQGAVGRYTMKVMAGPTNVAVGDPITLQLEISGAGALDSLAWQGQAWEHFKTYPPMARIDGANPLGTQGTKTFEQIVVPETTAIKELPPVSFSFFDPEQKRYHTLSQPAVPLTVRPGGAAAVPTFAAASRNGEAPAAQDIVPIKQRLGTVAQISPPLVRQAWFVGLQSVPLLALVCAVIWRRRNETLANNPRLRRQRQVAQTVREGLAELRQLAARNQADEFFATLFRLLQEQLGERLDLPASAITEAIIEERLRPRGVPDQTLAALHELFQTCNLARYAPVQTSQELAAIVPRLEAVLGELRGIKQ